MNPEYKSLGATEDAASNQLTRTTTSQFPPKIQTLGSNNSAVASENEVNDTGLPPQRKRSLIRRGGESQSTLFKAAALAAMSSPMGYESDGSTSDGEALRLAKLVPLAPSMPDMDHWDMDRSPRKRLRGSFNNSASVIDEASAVFGGLHMKDESSIPPLPRRQVRETRKAPKQLKK